MQHTLCIATRNSPLALWQAQSVKNKLEQAWPNLHITLLPMTTTGDRFLKDKLLTIGNKGLFVKELEEALLNHHADIAVHSMKDMPSVLPPGLKLESILKRDNPFDAFVSTSYQTFASLPLNATIGTSSLRRQSQLLALRPDLNMQTLRGNIHTRLEKLAQGAFDAIILAAAGLHRMNFEHDIQEIFDEHQLLPACGQGALGIECRAEDNTVQTLLKPLHDTPTALCVHAERHINERLGGNCHTPLAAFGQWISPSHIRLCAKLASADGKIVLQTQQTVPYEQAIVAAEHCAEDLITQGALSMLKGI